MAKRFNLGPFQGLNTSADSRFIPDGKAQAMSNYNVEDETLKVRFGYRNIIGSQASFQDAWGYEYLRGFNSSGVEKEEYVSFERISSVVKPWARDPVAGTPTEIKNGTTALSLNQSAWKGIVFNDQSYFFNPNQANSVARHAIGDATSWTELVPPAAPSLPTFTTAAIPSVSATGYHSATVVGTGSYSSTVNNDANLQFLNSVTPGVDSTVTVSFSPSTMGIQDLTNSDIVEMTFNQTTSAGFSVDPTSYSMDVINNDATPVTLPCTATFTQAIDANNILVQFVWDNKFSDFELGLTKVRLATQAALATNVYNNGTAGVGATLTASANGALGTIDSIAPALGDRVLVKTEATTQNNGIYVVSNLGSGSTKWVLTRATDADQPAEYLAGQKVYPTAGTVSTNLVYDCGATTVVLGTTALVFTVEGSPDTRGRRYFTDIAKFKLHYHPVARSSSAPNNVLQMSLPRYRRADTVNDWGISKTALSFGYTLYNSVADFESDISKVDIPRANFISIRTGDVSATGVPTGTGQGNIITLAFPVASVPSGVDKIRVYYLATDGSWHRVGEQLVSVLTFQIYNSDAETLNASNSPVLTPFTFKIDNCISATTFKGAWAIWGYRGGGENIRHSRIGIPISQASQLDLTTDLDRGATFGLFGDDPINMLEAGDAVIIIGNRGVYAQVDTDGTPAGMKPPARIPNTKGGVNQFSAARWRTKPTLYVPAGLPSVVWMTAQGELWEAAVTNDFNGQTGFRLSELGIEVRSVLQSFLALQSLTDFTSARMAMDDATDTLRIYIGVYALVLGRESVEDGTRDWQVFQYVANVGYIAFSTQRRMRWIRSTGQMDESDWDSSAGAFIEGTNRDGGSAMPASSIYWESKTITYDAPWRINAVSLERGNYSNTPTIQVFSSRQTDSRTYASGKRFVRFGPLQQGWEHAFKISGAEGDAPIKRCIVEAFGPIGSRELS